MWRFVGACEHVCMCAIIPLSVMVSTTSQPYTHAHTTGGGQGAGGEMRVLINWLLIARPAHINDRRICFLYIYLACIYIPSLSLLSALSSSPLRQTVDIFSVLSLSRVKEF